MEKILLITCFLLFSIIMILLHLLKDKKDDLKYYKDFYDIVNVDICRYKIYLKDKYYTKKQLKNIFKNLFDK